MRKRLSLVDLQLRSAQNKLLRDALLALIAIGAVLAITFGVAHAAAYTHCDHDGTCIDQVIPDSLNALGPKIIHVPPHEIDAAREKRWEDRCDPKIVEDDLGVERYTYKPGVVGCEFGKDR